MRLIGRFMFHLVTQIAFTSIAQAQRMPYCEECLPAKIHDAPGVGFDIGFSYGVSALHLYNGTIIDVTTTPAKPDYIALMKRLENSPVPPPPTKLRRFLRWLNKKRGLPATRDVGILSSLIAELYNVTLTANPSIENSRVVVTTPLIPALPFEDLNDAIEFAGLLSWQIKSAIHPGTLAESKAVAAASGIGICKDYKRSYSCERECYDEGWKNVYFIMFTQQALYTSLNAYDCSFGRSWESEDHIFETAFGLSNLKNFSQPSKFWEHVRSQLLFLPGITKRPVTEVVLAGESALDSTFLQVLRDALAEIVSQSGSDLAGAHLHQGSLAVDLDSKAIPNPLFAAARGAALYGRWRQESPFYCQEIDECEEGRKKQREAMMLGVVVMDGIGQVNPKLLLSELAFRIRI